MKKSVIALAVLAASGASFAQVTITGTLGMGYGMTTNVGQRNAVTNTLLNIGGGNTITQTDAGSTGANSSGFGIDTSSIEFNAKEDLGGGVTVAAMMSIDTVDRGSVKGGDAMLTYTNTAFGRIQLGTEKGGAVHSGIPSAGAPVINFDGKLFQQRSSSDFISLATKVGPVALVFKHSEGGDKLASASPARVGAGAYNIPAVNSASCATSAGTGGLGLGVGAGAGTASACPTAGTAGQRTTDLLAIYSTGPLQLVGGYRTYDNRDSVAINGTYGLTKDDVVIFAAGYDVGVAKLGFGYNSTKATVGARVDDMLFGVSVPVGALTLGATYARATVTGVKDTKTMVLNPANPAQVTSGIAGKIATMDLAEGSADGFSLGAKYDLSKRTNITVKYAQWTLSGYEQFEYANATGNIGYFGYKDKMSETSILLNHSF